MKRKVIIFIFSTAVLIPIVSIAGDKVVVIPLGTSRVAGTDGQIQYNDNGSTAASEIYYRKATGNVGIGQSTPTEALDVNGNIKANSFIGDGSNLTGVVTSESDPTVPATIKDGIGWSEILSRPADLIDGDDVGDPWIRIFDNEKVLIGYSLTFGLDNIISQNHYAGKFSTLDSGISFKSTYNFKAYFAPDDTSCSGTPFAESYQNTTGYPINPTVASNMPGSTGMIGVYDTDTPGWKGLIADTRGTYYIPKEATINEMKADTYYRFEISTFQISPSCTSYTHGGIWYAYEMLPNDPGVTGFKKSYPGPINFAYNLPSSP